MLACRPPPAHVVPFGEQDDIKAWSAAPGRGPDGPVPLQGSGQPGATYRRTRTPAPPNGGAGGGDPRPNSPDSNVKTNPTAKTTAHGTRNVAVPTSNTFRQKPPTPARRSAAPTTRPTATLNLIPGMLNSPGRR